MKKVNVKNLVLSSFLAAASLILLFIMFMPIISSKGIIEISMFDMATRSTEWYMLEEYLWGIGALVATISLPILFVGSVLSILSALGIIKNKKLDKALYIFNIVFAGFVFSMIVMYMVGLGSSLTVRGHSFFVGITYFDYATAFFYVHCVFSFLALVAACFNCPKAKKTKKAKRKKK